MEVLARTIPIPLKEYSCMPIGALSDQIDAYLILTHDYEEQVEYSRIPDLR